MSQMLSLFEELDPPRSLDEVKERWKDCKSCEFWPARKQVVFWDGTESAEVMFVGQFPGKGEEESGRCYSGKAGKLCRKAATNIAQVPKEKQFWTNTLACRPPGKLRASWIKNCRTLLDHQIRIVQPKLIVAMGGMAVKRMSKTLGRLGITETRLTTFYYQDVMSIAVLFPAAYYRAPTDDKRQEIVRMIKEDFSKVHELYVGGMN